MKFHFFCALWFYFSTLHTYAHAMNYARDLDAQLNNWPNIHINYNAIEQFDGNVQMIYRGIFFSSHHFTFNQANEFLTTDFTGCPLISSAGYDLGQSHYNASTHPLVQEGQVFQEMINGYSSDMRCFFQQRYSNSYAGFLKQLAEKVTGKYKNLNLPMRALGAISHHNPLLSFSSDLNQSMKYAAGTKTYGNARPILYDVNGMPKIPAVGMVQVILMDAQAVEQHCPLNVFNAHEKGKLKISTAASNNILAEKEISIPGYVDGDCVVATFPLNLPSFECQRANAQTLQFWGITQRQYQNIYNLFHLRKPSDTIEKRILQIVHNSSVMLKIQNIHTNLMQQYDLNHEILINNSMWL